MAHIAIISSSVRTGRKSHRVALYFKNYIEENNIGTAEILDLNEFQFPLFEERLRYQKEPTAKVLDFAERFRKADGVIIVTPEYNGGYPPSLKNVIDLLTDEWYHKPVAISTASSGSFGGTQVLIGIQFSLWKIRAWTIAAMFPNPKVHEAYDENGVPADKPATDKRAAILIKELMWSIEAISKMTDK